MSKKNSLLLVPIVVLSIISGLLFNQLVVQKGNSELKNKFSDLDAQLKEQQTVSRERETQITELDQQLINTTNRVKITVFTSNETSFPPLRGCFWYSSYVVTVLNFGINDVENLRIDFEGQYYGLEPDEPYYNEVYHNWTLTIGTVKVGESKTVHQWHQMPMDKPTVAWLMMGDVILDTRNFNE
jgi:hypothetical protein